MSVLARSVFAALLGAAVLSGCTDEALSGRRSGEETPATPPTRTATWSGLLVPNLRSVGAHDLEIETYAGGRRLRFAASLANLGPGPLLLQPQSGGSCPSGQHRADQVVHRDADGDLAFRRGRDVRTVSRDAGCMLPHPGHDHWHFDAMAAYSLRRAGQDTTLVSRDKVSFCLRDNVRVPGNGIAVRRAYFGDCTRNGPQGISPGWVDIYKADLDGQWLRLPPGHDRRLLCLDVTADPHGLLQEVDETDNGTSVPLRVDGTNVRRVDTDRCD